MFKSYEAAALDLMAKGYGYSATGSFKNGVHSVVVIKSSSGYWMVKSL